MTSEKPSVTARRVQQAIRLPPDNPPPKGACDFVGRKHLASAFSAFKRRYHLLFTSAPNSDAELIASPQYIKKSRIMYLNSTYNFIYTIRPLPAAGGQV